MSLRPSEFSGPSTSDGAAPPENAAPLPAAPATVVSPLQVSALVVEKADLIAALRVYIPQLTDVTVLDEDRFILSIAPAELTPAKTD